MKRMIFAITAAMVMSASTVQAQNVNTVISTDDFDACKQYLDGHPADTIRNLSEPIVELWVSCDTVVSRNQGKTIINLLKGDKLIKAGIDVFMVGKEVAKGNHYVVLRLNQLPPKQVADSALVRKIDEAAEKTQVALISRSYGQEQDVNFYEASVHRTTDGKIPARDMEKNGLSLVAGVGYRYGEGKIHAFTAQVGAQLTSDWGGFTRLTYRFTTAKHPDNAVEANGSYMTHGFRPSFGWRFALDKYRVWHLELSAGPGFDFQRTETEKNENGLLQSTVFAMYPFAEAGVSWEPFNSRVGFFLNVGWEQSQILKQNDGNTGKNCVTAAVALIVPLFK